MQITKIKAKKTDRRNHKNSFLEALLLKIAELVKILEYAISRLLESIFKGENNLVCLSIESLEQYL